MSQKDLSDKIIGFDPGSRIAGFGCLAVQTGVVDVKKAFRVLDAGVIRLDTKQTYSQRFVNLQNVVGQLLDEFSPSVCVLERAFLGVNAASALKLGEVRGLVMAECARRKIEIVEVSPTEVKKVVTGNGRSSKEQVSSCLETLLDFKRGNLPHDASDALAIALTCALSKPFSNLVKRPNRNVSNNIL